MYETEHVPTPMMPRRGIQLLPSILTTGNIFFGFLAITASWAGDFDNATRAIGIAILLDGLDGRIARLTNAASQFGLQLDSLADTVSFGVAPACLLYSWKLKGFQVFAGVDIGWIACFLFLVGGVMRLARFNVQKTELKHFVGLPIPGGAGIVAATIHFAIGSHYKNSALLVSGNFSLVIFLFTILLGILMVSTFRYPSFKSLQLRGKNPYFTIFFIALLIAVIWAFSREALFILAAVYLFSGMISTLRHKYFPSTMSADQRESVAKDEIQSR